MTKLTTHCLDTFSGKPAKGIKVDIYTVSGKKEKINSTILNNNGRSDKALLEGSNFKEGEYELVFFVGDYFKNIPNLTLNGIIQEFESQTGRYNYRKYITHLFDPKVLEEYARQDIFISNFKQYFGLEPKIRFISIWIDSPTSDRFEKNSQIFHRDSDDIFLVKTFLCLTKIEKDNGPFEFIETSHKRPWDLNIKNYVNNKETDLVKTFHADEGDMYIADTNGFHRGRLLSNGYRVLLTVHYVSNKPRVGFLKQVIN